jgi:hypothetical protein
MFQPNFIAYLLLVLSVIAIAAAIICVLNGNQMGKIYLATGLLCLIGCATVLLKDNRKSY